MLSNYLKIAFRSLTKFKGYAAINLFGLALGLTAGIMIMLYVADELSYDRFHANIDRIYRVGTQFVANKSGEEDGGSNETNGWPIGQVLRTDFPEVEAVLYTRNGSWLTVNVEDRRIQQAVHFASPEFFDIFSFRLKNGNPKTALTQPYTIVITEGMAQKYFPGRDALNNTLVLGDTLSFQVTGVMENLPSNSHIQVDMLISFSTYPLLNPDFSYDEGWGNINVRNYVLLREGADFNTFSAKARNIYTERAGQMLKDWGVEANVFFTPLRDIYLTSGSNGMGPVGSLDRVYLVGGIACFVILLGCINFVNLTTARSVYRAREVGLRKVVGSTRLGLIRQFLSESFLLTVLALVIALALTGVLLPLFNELLGKSYTLTALFTLRSLLGLGALVLLVTLLSGYYPAMVMSAMRPAEVLKGRMQSGARGVRLRSALVVFQFVVSVGLVLGTLVVLSQLRYMQQQELGFAKDQIFVVNATRVRNANPVALETFKDKMRSLAIVDNVTFTNSLPGNPGWIGQVAYPEGRSGDDAISVEYMAIDPDYISTLGLEIVAGRGFDRNYPTEMAEGLVLNETAVSMFGWASPEEAIGKVITSPSAHPAGKVIGVVKDYHQFGLQQKVGPMAMDCKPRYGYMYAVRYKAADTQQLISSLETLWKKHFPGYEFNYFFLDQDFESQYQAEQKLALVFALFAAIAIVIAVIGLLGLVSFMVAARTKEIGVRKVLGADIMSITSLLSKEFLILVIVANAIAFPLTWYFADQWLQNFANRVALEPWIFLVTLIIAVGVTLLTISFQTIRAAMTDPVKSLRYE